MLLTAHLPPAHIVTVAHCHTSPRHTQSGQTRTDSYQPPTTQKQCAVQGSAWPTQGLAGPTACLPHFHCQDLENSTALPRSETKLLFLDTSTPSRNNPILVLPMRVRPTLTLVFTHTHTHTLPIGTKSLSLYGMALKSPLHVTNGVRFWANLRRLGSERQETNVHSSRTHSFAHFSLQGSDCSHHTR